jgi:hypothetical protein
VLFKPRRPQARRDPRGDFADRQLHRRPWRTCPPPLPGPRSRRKDWARSAASSPTNAPQRYVTNAHDGANAGTVSAFAFGADGAPTMVAASPFPDEQTAPRWVEISHDDQYLLAVNTASGLISSYSIATGGSLTLTGLSTSPTPAPIGAAPAGIVVTGDSSSATPSHR